MAEKMEKKIEDNGKDENGKPSRHEKFAKSILKEGTRVTNEIVQAETGLNIGLHTNGVTIKHGKKSQLSNRELIEKIVTSIIIYTVFTIIVLGPIVTVILISFSPNVYKDGISPTSLKWYEVLFTTPKYYNPLIRTLEIASITLLIQLAVGTSIAYITIRKKVFAPDFLDSASNITIALPSVIIGLALLAFYGSWGPMAALHQLVFGNPTTILGTFWIVVLAHVLETFPYMVRSVSSVLVKLDPNVEIAARTLGGTRWYVFKTITLPQLLPGIISGSVLTVSRSIAEFGATIIVVSALLKTAPISIYGEADMGQFELACAYAVILMAISFFIHFGLARKFLKEHRSV
ncbi:MAG: ABC transporter permease [Thermoplasmata archaeon]